MHDEEFQVRKQQLDQGWAGALDQEGMSLEEAVLVRAIRSRRVSLYRCGGMELGPGQRVVVETERGTTEGLVLERPTTRWVQLTVVRRVVRPLDRPPEGWQAQRYQERENQAKVSCRGLMARLRLDMKLVEVEYVWWENRTVFYFVAEGRVDFRDMVKELSRNLRCRIEMRQVGPRDETKMLQGYGRCGREHCCSAYLSEFHSVRTKMAKEQGIVVNQDKITGHCRKLLCCLAYERDTYSALRQEMPAMGSRVETPDGKGKIVELHVIRGGIKVLLDDGGGAKEFPRDKVRPLDGFGGGDGQVPGALDGGGDDAALRELEDDGSRPREVVVVEDEGRYDGAHDRQGGPEDRRHHDRTTRGPQDRGRRGRGPHERGEHRPSDRSDSGGDDRRDRRGGNGRGSRPHERGERRPPDLQGSGPEAPSDHPPDWQEEPTGAAPEEHATLLPAVTAGEGAGQVPERTGRRRRRRRRGGGGGQGQHGPDAPPKPNQGNDDGGWDGGPEET
ncbi:MAG: hypothetical protein FJ109_13525 [Deltaproteobacteria bacterium]|nr:hypothetical protein [Deltaproteobacteria bacterium]